MAKAYQCSDCKIIRSQKWTGRCPGCFGFYNVRVTNADDGSGTERPEPVADGQIVTLDDVAAENQERISTEIVGLDRVLGVDKLVGNYGIAAKAGHVIQLYGGPGAGKSTLLLQACKGLTKQRHKVLYIAGEESLEQIKSRANRIGKFNSCMQLVRETDLDSLLDSIEEAEAEIVVVDSINMIEVDEYESGSMSAVKIAAKEFVKMAKKFGFGLILVVQLTKSNDYSGPKALEHLVDTSLYFRNESGRKTGLRTIECKGKNRHGSTPVFASFNMSKDGVLIEASFDDGTDDDDEEVEEVKVAAKKTTTKGKKAEAVPEKPEPHLKVLPSNGIHTVSRELIIPKNAKEVLAVPCDACEAKVDRACTSDSGVREAGFHQSRVTKSQLHIVSKDLPTRDDSVAQVEPVLSSRLSAKPRLKAPKKPKPKKPAPQPPTSPG